MTPRAWLAFASLGVVWGLPYVLIKIALVGVAPLEVAWWEVTIGAAVLLPLAWARGALAQVTRHWKPIGALALLQLAVPSSLTPISEQWIRASLAGVLAATAPLLIALLGPLFGVRERFSVQRIAGLLVGFSGVVVLLGLDAPHGAEWIGVACISIAALAYALAPLVIQRYLHAAEGLGPCAASLTLASLLLCPAGVSFLPPSVPSPRAIASLLGLGAVCTASGMLLYFFVIKEAGAARAGVVKYVSPIVAALLGALVLGEAFPLSSVIGMILILSGSWVATAMTDRRMQMAEPDTFHATGQPRPGPHVRTRARAKIVVQSSKAEHYDQAEGPELVELRLTETFTGDMEGESPVRAFQVLRADKSACQVSMQRFHGKLGGRRGTFVLQGSEIVDHGKIKASWFVVPGSGTGELVGLRGEGGFEGGFGKGSDGTLDYWFE